MKGNYLKPSELLQLQRETGKSYWDLIGRPLYDDGKDEDATTTTSATTQQADSKQDALDYAIAQKLDNIYSGSIFRYAAGKDDGQLHSVYLNTGAAIQPTAPLSYSNPYDIPTGDIMIDTGNSQVPSFDSGKDRGRRAIYNKWFNDVKRYEGKGYAGQAREFISKYHMTPQAYFYNKVRGALGEDAFANLSDQTIYELLDQTYHFGAGATAPALNAARRIYNNRYNQNLSDEEKQAMVDDYNNKISMDYFIDRNEKLWPGYRDRNEKGFMNRWYSMPGHVRPVSDQQYDNYMNGVGERNYRIWGFDTPEDATDMAKADDSYNYRGYLEQHPTEANNIQNFYLYPPGTMAGADSHWPDTFKTSSHSTFSDESQYSGKKSYYNPHGRSGGNWLNDIWMPPTLMGWQGDQSVLYDKNNDYFPVTEWKPTEYDPGKDLFVRQKNDHPIAFDSNGNLVDQVSGETGSMMVPEITITPTPYPDTHTDWAKKYAEKLSHNILAGFKAFTRPFSAVSDGQIIDFDNPVRVYDDTENLKNILVNDFVEDTPNNIRAAKDFKNTTDTLIGDKQIPLSHFSNYYGLENGKLKIGNIGDFDDNTTVVPVRNKTRLVKSVDDIIGNTDSLKNLQTQYETYMTQKYPDLENRFKHTQEQLRELRDVYKNTPEFVKFLKGIASGFTLGQYDPYKTSQGYTRNDIVKEQRKILKQRASVVNNDPTARRLQDDIDRASKLQLGYPKVAFITKSGDGSFMVTNINQYLGQKKDELNRKLQSVGGAYPVMVDNGRYQHYETVLPTYESYTSGDFYRNQNNMYVIGNKNQPLTQKKYSKGKNLPSYWGGKSYLSNPYNPALAIPSLNRNFMGARALATLPKYDHADGKSGGGR